MHSPQRTVVAAIHKALARCGLIAGLALTSGCATESVFLAETFQGAPRGWVVIERDGVSPARDLRVVHGHLALDGARLLRQEFELFEDFNGIADIVLGGGDSSGFGGVFIEESHTGAGGSGSPTASLAVNARGEWRGYRGNPLTPLGRAGWVPLRSQRLGAPIRFVVGRRGEDVWISIVGEPGARFEWRSEPAPAPRSADSAAGAAGDERVFRVGVFTYLLDVGVDNVIVGESDARGPFQPEPYAWWGSSADAASLERLSRERASAFASSPRRMDFLGVLQPLVFASRIYAQIEDAGRRAEVEATAARLFRELRPAVELARADDLLRDAVEAWRFDDGAAGEVIEAQLAPLVERSARAESQGRLAEALVFAAAASEVRASAELSRRMDALLERVAAPLRLDLEIETLAASTLPQGFERVPLSAAQVSRPILDAFGEIPRGRPGELTIAVTVEEATVQHDRSEATRRVAVTTAQSPLSESDRRELERLERQFNEDLADARAHALVARAGKLTPNLEVELRRVEFEGFTRAPVEIHSKDLAALRKTYGRIRELTALRDKEAKLSSRAVTFKAISVLDLARFRLTYSVRLDDRELITGEVKSAEGVEEWEHDAVSEGEVTVPASKADPRAGAFVVERARARVLERLRTAISRESLFARVAQVGGADGARAEDAATALLIRIARATASRDDASLLEWRLKFVYGLDGLTLEKVTRRLAGE